MLRRRAARWCWPTRWPRPCTRSPGSAPLSGDPYRLAGELGMPPWRVQKAQKQVAALVTRLGGRGDAVGRGAQRRRQGCGGGCRLRARDGGAPGGGTGRRRLRARGLRDQILLSASASADFLLAAWFLWMTPLLAALSSLRLVRASNSAALSFSPASTASRNPRTAVRSDGLHRLVAQPGALVGEDALLLRLDVGHACDSF